MGLGSWEVGAALYDSATQVDMILGYPWLRSHQLGILPHRNALLAEGPKGRMVLLKSWTGPMPKSVPPLGSAGESDSEEEEQAEETVPFAPLGPPAPKPVEDRKFWRRRKSVHFEEGRDECAPAGAHSRNSAGDATVRAVQVGHITAGPLQDRPHEENLWEIRRMQLKLPAALGAPEEPLADEEALIEACRALAFAAKSVAEAVKRATHKRHRRRKKPRVWISERYAVRASIIKDIVAKLGCETPVLDSFADSGNHRFPRWWGPGGERPDAMAESWAETGLLWCNPPFSQFSAVVDKVARDKARCILVMPDWPFKEYWSRVQPLRVAETYYPAGTSVFELDGEPVPGTKWGTWAYLLDG